MYDNNSSWRKSDNIFNSLNDLKSYLEKIDEDNKITIKELKNLFKNKIQNIEDRLDKLENNNKSNKDKSSISQIINKNDSQKILDNKED